MASLNMRIKILGVESLEAFYEAIQMIDEMIEDYPWLDLLRDVREKLSDAAKGLAATDA